MKLESLLLGCCSYEDVRKQLNNPFRVGEYVYASDCRVLVRTTRPVDVELGDIFGKAEPSFIKLFKPTTPIEAAAKRFIEAEDAYGHAIDCRVIPTAEEYELSAAKEALRDLIGGGK